MCPPQLRFIYMDVSAATHYVDVTCLASSPFRSLSFGDARWFWLEISAEENPTGVSIGPMSTADLSVCVCVFFFPFSLSLSGKVYVEEKSDVWRLAAISSFSVLAVVLVGAALIIGVLVHREKSQKRPLRGKSLGV